MTAEHFRPVLFTAEEQDDVLVLHVRKPRLSEEENVDLFGQELATATEQYAQRRVVLDMKSVEYANSAALGRLIVLHRRLKRENGKLVVCEAGPVVDDALRTSRLNTYFTITKTLDEAVEAARSDAEGSTDDEATA